MKRSDTTLPGVIIIDPERIEDPRGFFARTYCASEFAECGLNPALSQCSISFNHQKGTVRGMHWQSHPAAEVKLVRCTMGAIYDIALDLRPDSPTCGRWFAVELSMDNRRMLYIPEGVAHGFQTLCDNAEVLYQISTPQRGEFARGVRWDDPAFDIRLPLAVTVISDRDRSFPPWG